MTGEMTNKLMRCPHCEGLSDCVPIGFGGDWVICQVCQRRLRWTEARGHLVRDVEGGAGLARYAMGDRFVH